MANRALAAASLLAVVICMSSAASAQEVPAFEDDELKALASPELQTSDGEQGFRRYLRETDRAYRKRHPRRRHLRGTQRHDDVPELIVAQAEVTEPVCTDPELCPEDTTETVVVTGS